MHLKLKLLVSVKNGRRFSLMFVQIVGKGNISRICRRKRKEKKKKNKRILGKNTTDHILPHQYQTKKGEKENLTALRRYYENQSLFFPKISFQND